LLNNFGFIELKLEVQELRIENDDFRVKSAAYSHQIGNFIL